MQIHIKIYQIFISLIVLYAFVGSLSVYELIYPDIAMPSFLIGNISLFLLLVLAIRDVTPKQSYTQQIYTFGIDLLFIAISYLLFIFVGFVSSIFGRISG